MIYKTSALLSLALCSSLAVAQTSGYETDDGWRFNPEFSIGAGYGLTKMKDGDFDEDEAAKKQVFIDEGGEPADFYYDHPVKKEFNAVYSDFRKQLDTYYKEREQDQKQNLSDRLQIIDELKALYLEPNENSSNIFTQFRKIKTRWHNAGPIPKSHAGNVFKTYFHHLDNFYEYLNLNKELREMDYAHNLEIRESPSE